MTKPASAAPVTPATEHRPRCPWHDVEFIALSDGVLSCVLCATERRETATTYTAAQIAELLRPFGLVVGETTDGGLRIYHQPRPADQLTAQSQALAALVAQWRQEAQMLDDGHYVTMCAVGAANLRHRADQLEGLLAGPPEP